MIILNLTQHVATAEQSADGVIGLPQEAQDMLTALLTFTALPTAIEISQRAHDIALLAALHSESAIGIAIHAMIGGAPWLMGPLVVALRREGIEPVFAFSVRETVDQRMDDGGVRKTAIFRHAGFVPAL